MPSALTIDLEALLVPIAGENPSGTSLRYEGTHDAIKELRREDTLPTGDIWTTSDTKTANWNGVIDAATAALTQKSKDLQIASWLVEALAKQHGFAGLRDGFQLLRQLQERFWHTLYPELEDGDAEFRASPLAGLNATLPLTIKRIALARSSEGDPYTLLQWEDASRLDNLARQNQQDLLQAEIDDGKATTEQLNKIVNIIPRSFYETLFEDIQQCREQYEQLALVTDTNFGRTAPSLLNIKKAVDDCYDVVRPIRKSKREREGLKDETDPPKAAAATVRPRSASSPVTVVSPSPAQQTLSGGLPLEPQSREDALLRLQAVASYFRRTEPHSPISYLVQRAARWGAMPLEQWLQEVVKDQGVLGSIWETLGIDATNVTNGEHSTETSTEEQTGDSEAE